MKISIGTAQWGLNYGLNNFSGKIDNNQIKEIIDFSTQNNIYDFDTSSAYGDAESKLGKYSNKRLNITTKIVLDNKSEVNELVLNSLNNINLKSIYACLIHNPSYLRKKDGIWFEFLKQKEYGRFNKIGYSIYEPKELFELLDLGYFPDIIQIPYNIMNRSFETYFEELKNLNIEIHVRSVFLQGLLIEQKLREKFLLVKKGYWDLYDNWLALNKLKPLEGCLAHVISQKQIDKIVVGIDNIFQLKEISEVYKKIKINTKAPDVLEIKDSNIYDPRKWSF